MRRPLALVCLLLAAVVGYWMFRLAQQQSPDVGVVEPDIFMNLLKDF